MNSLDRSALSDAPLPQDGLRRRAKALNLHGLIAHWSDVDETAWIQDLIQWEEEERARRSLERRLGDAHIGRFKPLCDFDWDWPVKCDRAAVEDLMSLDFIGETANAVLRGPNGIGKTMIAQNVAHQAVIQGHTAIFTSAGQCLFAAIRRASQQLFGELAAIDSATVLKYRLNRYARPALLVIDEVGYLSYSNRAADLFFELVSRRYQCRSTLITTNKPFAEWSEVFPNAACVVSLVDRLVHNAEVIDLDGEAYRNKEARERAELRAKKRKRKKA
jgi:DNA replication protein DnaC